MDTQIVSEPEKEHFSEPQTKNLDEYEDISLEYKEEEKEEKPDTLENGDGHRDGGQRSDNKYLKLKEDISNFIELNLNWITDIEGRKGVENAIEDCGGEIRVTLGLLWHDFVDRPKNGETEKTLWKVHRQSNAGTLIKNTWTTTSYTVMPISYGQDSALLDLLHGWPIENAVWLGDSDKLQLKINKYRDHHQYKEIEETMSPEAMQLHRKILKLNNKYRSQITDATCCVKSVDYSQQKKTDDIEIEDIYDEVEYLLKGFVGLNLRFAEKLGLSLKQEIIKLGVIIRRNLITAWFKYEELKIGGQNFSETLTLADCLKSDREIPWGDKRNLLKLRKIVPGSPDVLEQLLDGYPLQNHCWNFEKDDYMSQIYDRNNPVNELEINLSKQIKQLTVNYQMRLAPLGKYCQNYSLTCVLLNELYELVSDIKLTELTQEMKQLAINIRKQMLLNWAAEKNLKLKNSLLQDAMHDPTK